MKTLIWRMCKRTWSVQLALALLMASALVVLAIYGAFLQREKDQMGRRIEHDMPVDAYFVTDDPRTNPSTGLFISIPVELVAGWVKETVPSNFGDLPVTFIDFTNTANRGMVPSGSAALHSLVAARFGIDEGDPLILVWRGQTYHLVVSDISAEVTLHGTGLHGRNIYVNAGYEQTNTNFLYRRRKGQENTAHSALIRAISNNHSRPVIVSGNDGATLGSAMVDSSYNMIAQSKFILLIFLSVAFLTAKLISYMEGRKMLAILKALGLTRWEVAGTFVAEALAAPVLGILLGSGIATVILSALNSAGQDMVPSFGVITMSAVSLLPALVLGTAIPARFAQISSVNELMFERAVPLMRDRVTSLRRKLPQIDKYVSKGIQFVQLEVISDVFDGFIFRQIGDKVQSGEVMALGLNWWGLKVREYIAPIDGEIVYHNKESGLMGVAPAGLRITEVEDELNKLPRIKLGLWPTPLQHLEAYGKQNNYPSLYLKREDLNGFMMGGHMVRALEYQLGDAMADQATTVFALGEWGMNERQLMHAAALRAGLDCTIVPIEEGKDVMAALHDQLPCAQATYVLKDDARAALGYLTMVLELYRQCVNTEISLQHVLVGGSSTAEAVGYAFGIALMSRPFHLHVFKHGQQALAEEEISTVWSGLASILNREPPHGFSEVCSVHEHSALTELKTCEVQGTLDLEGIIGGRGSLTSLEMVGYLEATGQLSKKDKIVIIHTPAEGGDI